MTHTAFSVIVPAYNAAPYIDACIQSVLSQTYRDFELIIVDDGSSDATAAIIEKYEKADDRIRVFHKENGGHTSARNLGLENSVGAYILFVDADDVIEPTVLALCHEQIARHAPDIVVYGFRAQNAPPALFANGIADGFYRFADRENGLLENILMSPTGSFVFPKSLSGKAFLREKLLPSQLAVPQDVRVGEDGACFIRMCLNSESVAVTSEASYLCTVNPSSVSHSGDAQALARCLSLFEYYRASIAEKGACIKEQFRRYAVHHLFSSLQFAVAAGVSNAALRAQLRRVMQNPIVKDAVKHARFDKRAKKMRVKHFIVKHRMLFAVRWLVRKKSTIS